MSLDARAPALRVVEGERGDLALGVADPHSSAGAGCSAVDDGERDDPVEDGDPHVRALAPVPRAPGSTSTPSGSPFPPRRRRSRRSAPERALSASAPTSAPVPPRGNSDPGRPLGRPLRRLARRPRPYPDGSAARPSSRARRPLLGHSRCSTPGGHASENPPDRLFERGDVSACDLLAATGFPASIARSSSRCSRTASSRRATRSRTKPNPSER